MPQLQIVSADGQVKQRKLSRRNPIVIGRNPISDIHIDDESVAAIHCRVLWNGKAFEVTAVADAGVDVNGVLVRRKELTEGDVLRIGGVDLEVLNGSGTGGKKAAHDAEAEEVIGAPLAVSANGAAEAPSRLAEDEWSKLSSGDVEFDVVAPTSSLPSSRSKASQDDAEAEEEAESEDIPDDEPVLLDVPEQSTTEPTRQEPKAKAEPQSEAAPKRSATAKRWGLSKAKRPGEQDILGSPLVLGLSGLALILLLAAGAIWLLMGREAADRLYASATGNREAGRYTQAIQDYERFLVEYATDDRARNARFALGLARIERYALGATPNFDRAIEEVDTFVRANRDAAGFDEQRDSLRDLARKIASGASAAAIRTGDRKYLESSRTARSLFDRYSTPDSSNDAASKQLSNEFAKAEASVRKFEYTNAAAEAIAAAIGQNDFATAFKTRRDLLTRYPDLRNDRRVRVLLEKTLAAEKAQVRRVGDLAERFPQEDLRSQVTDIETLMLIGQTQARAGEVSDGRVVFAFAQGALVGLEAVTGEPRWRRMIGLDPPFFPIEVDASVPALLVFNTARNAAELVTRDTGEILWRTSLGTGVAGPPLVLQGQVDFVTNDAQLVRLDLESGTLIDAISFPQPLVGPPVSIHEFLVVFGEQATAYTLDERTLAMKSVSFVGHSAGAIQSPPQTLGQLIVACENNQLNAATMSAFSCDAESGVLKQIGAEGVEGQIQQRLVPRGNVLFVPSEQERITVFGVSDDAGQAALTRLAAIQIPGGKDVPTFLVPGPDGLLWAAGSALRKLKLAADGLSLLPEELAAGVHTQPPQESGESLFVARSLASAAAVYVSQADRSEMRGSWRTILGANVVAAASNEGKATLVNAAGQFVVLGESDLEAGEFPKTRPLTGWDETIVEPLQGVAVSKEGAIVWRGGETPLLWSIKAGSQPGQPKSLASAPECPPVAVDEGFVLPLPGQLAWLPVSGGEKVEAFLLPVQADPALQATWRSLAAIDGEQVVALDDKNTLRVIRLRREPTPHLDEVASAELPQAPTQPLAVVDGRIVVAASERIQVFDPAGLRPIADIQMEQPLLGGPWSAAGTVFVQLNDETLVALEPPTLAHRWSIELDAPAAGQPVEDEEDWVVVSQTGTALWVDEQGTEIERLSLKSPITSSIRIGNRVAALGLDGTLNLLPLSLSNEGEAEAVNDAASAKATSQPKGAGP